jgi:membrane protein
MGDGSHAMELQVMSFLKDVFHEFSKNRCTTMAAALAFYTAFALPPLLYLLVMVISLSLSLAYESDESEKRAQALVERQASQLLGNPSASEEISTILQNNQESGGQWWKTLLSLIGILVAATGVVASLQDALNRVWEVQPDPQLSGIKDMIGKRLLSFSMILGLGFVLLVSQILYSVLFSLGSRAGSLIGIESTVVIVINYAVQALVIFVIFAAIFKIMPDAEVQWKDVLVGALVTTILFLVGQWAMQLYFSLSNPAAQLGSAAASFAILLLWVYYSGVILLLGAEFTQVYAVRYGAGIHPEKKAVRVVEEIKR